MFHDVRSHVNPVYRGGLPGADLKNVGGELPLNPRRTRKKALHRLLQAVSETGWPDESQRHTPSTVELCVQYQERQAPEVVAVQMRNEDRMNAVRIDPEFSHGDKAGGA